MVHGALKGIVITRLRHEILRNHLD
jgi:hypothetical protein